MEGNRATEQRKAEVLKNFMDEFFDFDALATIGFFKPEMKNDYQAQADRVCQFFGYNTVFEYGATEFSCHITFAGERPKDEPFITAVKSIYES